MLRSHHRKNRGAWPEMAATNGLTVAYWDVTIPDSLANSHLPRTSAVGGAAAEEASLRKISKYTGVRQRYDFVAIAVESLDPINWGWVVFFEGDRQAPDNHFGWPTRNQLPPSVHFSNPSTLQCRCLSGQFSRGFRTHRLRSQWKCGFIGLYFVVLQGSFEPGAENNYFIIIHLRP